MLSFRNTSVINLGRKREQRTMNKETLCEGHSLAGLKLSFKAKRRPFRGTLKSK